MSNSFSHALSIFRPWNWKAALLSALTRAPIFLITTHKYGWHQATLAAGVEAAYWAVASGILASVVQSVRDWRPVWLAALLIMAGIPLFSCALDYGFHSLMRTPNLRKGMLASLTFSEITALFNWYSMQRGTMLVGKEQKSFLHDLSRMPLLWLGFIVAPFLWTWKLMQRASMISNSKDID